MPNYMLVGIAEVPVVVSGSKMATLLVILYELPSWRIKEKKSNITGRRKRPPPVAKKMNILA